MISPEVLFHAFRKNGVSQFTGVPDSFLAPFCNHLIDNANMSTNPRHIVAANEGLAVALAAGHYLAKGEISVVYMQNSGLGNALNPLVSLTDRSVYSIPMVLLIGWRGEPGTPDEPQHALQGEKTLELLETISIPYSIIDANSTVEELVQEGVDRSLETLHPYALIARSGAFLSDTKGREHNADTDLSRNEAIRIVLESLGSESIVVASTGMISREVFNARKALCQGHSADFLTVGSMGHASQIALGIAMNTPAKMVYCFEGDGSLIMHMGALATIGFTASSNFRHVILNNGVHDSVGGQPTTGPMTDFPSVARACGYNDSRSVKTRSNLISTLESFHSAKGPKLLDVKVRPGAVGNLGRPETPLISLKKAFMDKLRDDARNIFWK